MRLLHRLTILGLAVVAVVGLWGGISSAQDAPASPAGAYVGGTTTVAPTPPQSEVESAALTASAPSSTEAPATSGEVASSTLAFTGGDVLALTLMGVAAVAVGFVMLGVKRRNAHHVE